MHNTIKFALMLMLAIVCVGISTTEDAAALKVYQKSGDFIGNPVVQLGVVKVELDINKVYSMRHNKYLVQGFSGKPVDAQFFRPTKAKPYIMFDYRCPGYYTTRFYSDLKGLKQIGYIQVYVAQGDIKYHSKCQKVTPPKSSKPKPQPTEQQPYPEPEPDPEPDPPKPKPIHPIPTVDVKVKETVKPAPKPTPTPPKPEPAKPPAPPPTPPPTPPTAEELNNAVCKRTAEWTKLQGGEGNGYNPTDESSWAAATGNTLYKYPNNYPNPVVDKNKQYFLDQVKKDGTRYDGSYDYYVLKANSSGDALCCPIGQGLKNIAIGEGVYTCGTFSEKEVQASYCVASGSTTARYDATTNQCVDDVTEFEYEGDPHGWPLEMEAYEVEETDIYQLGSRNLLNLPTYEDDTGETTEEPPATDPPPATEEPPAESGGCELCKIFECPGFEEIVLPGFKQVGAELIGSVETPPVPDIPRPSMPNLFDVLNNVDERNGNLPTGEDGIKDAGFDAADVKEQAPEIPVRPDTTGGFDIVDPVEALPDDYSDAPVPDGEEIPIPASDYSDAPAPSDDYDATATPPSYGSDDGTATPPGEYDATATPPSYDGTATPPDYNATAIPPYTE